jgi:adenylate cyclase
MESRNKKFFSYFYNRKLRVDILTLFLLLITLTSAFIIAYSYVSNSKAIMEFSTGTVDRVSAVISEKMTDVIKELQIVPQIAGSQLIDLKDVSFENESLISFMLTAVKFYPHLHAILVGTEEGNFIEAVDLRMINHNFFLSDPSKPLPAGILFALRTIDRSVTPPVEKWEYKDENFKTIEKETVSRVFFDPRQRPWYKGAKATGKLFWADKYVYDPTQDRGIAVSNPIYNKEGKLIAIVAADLSLKTLHYFLSDLEIGKNGKAFLVDNTGRILAPKEMNTPRGITPDIVAQAFAHFRNTGQENFQFESGEVAYLAGVDPFPVPFEKPWYSLIVVPVNDFFSDLLQTQIQVGLISLLILLVASILVVYFSKRISRPIVELTKEVDKMRHLEVDDPSMVKSNIREIVQLNDAISAAKVMLRSFVRYVPRMIVKQMMEQGQEIELGGEKKEITLLFSDVANFTPIAESLSVDVLMPPLAVYFGIVSQCIIDSQGTIDKYMGDGVMAFWGAPKELNEHAQMGCLAALHCHAKLKEMNKKNLENGEPTFYTRFGINTGKAIVGNIGTTKRMNYTAMGDVVNIAARLEQINKVYGTSIIISEETKKNIGNNFVTRPIDFVAVKGKRNQIKIYELMGVREGEEEIKASKEMLELSYGFTMAYEAQQRGETDEAKKLFTALLAQFPEDNPTKLRLEAIK